MTRDLETMKRAICEIGQRIYQRGFAAANDGNISWRIDERRVLCTPTMICKGFMQSDDLCVVDLAGNQLAGQRRRSSEILMHLAILKARPDVQSVVHCHPPHVAAFAITRTPLPRGVLPEVEISLGEVPLAPYATPGTEALAESVLPFVAESNAIILANHGAVSYGPDVQRAYWLTEILDNYCRVLLLARQLGQVQQLSDDELRQLQALRTGY